MTEQQQMDVMSNNPYEPSRLAHLHTVPNPVNRRRWALIGFVIGCVPIATLGAFGLYVDAQYAATLPPNTARCGNNAMAAMLLIFPVSPMIGILGAGIGFVGAVICNAVTNSGSPKPEDVS
jgi:hypothetical protein